MSEIIIYLISSLFWGICVNLPFLFLIMWKNYLTIPRGVTIGAITAILCFIISPILWICLLCFFFSSSFLSKWKQSEKHEVNLEFAKSSQRDSVQVISNSFPAIFFGILYLIFENFPRIISGEEISLGIQSHFLFAAFTTIATHTADTWMTEIGIIYGKNPRLLINLKKKVNPGTSGGVSIEGTIAGMIGAAIISFVYVLSSLFTTSISLPKILLLSILLCISGIIGGGIDSLEGATIQRIYYCEQCKKETETNPHKCGNIPYFLRGYSFVTNDFVNLSSAFLSGFIAIVCYSFVEIIF